MDAPGLSTILCTGDFGEWDVLVANTLGHHRSRLRSGSGPFKARIQTAAVEEFQMLLIEGQGQVELLREQCGHGVLWMPLRGATQEIINGCETLAEPGMGLLFQPGDAMQGSTSEELLGVSILIPERHLLGSGATSPLLARGPLQRQLIDAAHQVCAAAAWQPPGSCHSAAALVEALHQWCHPVHAVSKLERSSARRRRDTVAQACQWISDHLSERFSVVELSKAMGVSVRSLQYAFQQELGHTPMAEAKRLRLRHLRYLLQQPNLQRQSIAALMEASGLLAGGATAADYRRWCGESPRQTRRRNDHRPRCNPLGQDGLLW